jgi:hypothetical protein
VLQLQELILQSFVLAVVVDSSGLARPHAVTDARWLRHAVRSSLAIRGQRLGRARPMDRAEREDA